MSLARHFATLLSGRLISQMILIVSTPILTRLFAPEDFGVITLVGSLTQIPAILLMGRLDQALPQSRTDKEAGHLFTLSLGIAICIVFLCLCIAIFTGPWLSHRYQQPLLTPLLLTAIILLCPQALSQLGKQWAAYRERHAITASADVVFTVARRGTPIPLYFMCGGTPWALLTGQALGVCASACLFMSKLWGDIRHHLSTDLQGLRTTLRTYLSFSLYLSGASLFDLLAWSLLSVIIGDLFGVAAIGWFGQAHALLLLPTSLLNQAASNVFYPRLAKARSNPAELRALLKRMMNLSLDLCLYPFMALLPLAPSLWELLLGDAFKTSGDIAQVLIPMVILNVIVSPVTVIVNVLHLQRPFFWQSLGLNIARTTALLIGGFTGGLIWSLACYAITTALIKAAQLIWLMKQGGVSSREVIHYLPTKLAYCLTMTLGLVSLTQADYSLWLRLIAATVAGIGWGLIVIKLNPDAALLIQRVRQRMAK